MIQLTINNKKVSVTGERTILEACREHGFEIPTLCYHPALEPFGACRLCVVEVSSSGRPARLTASCVTPCADGMLVETHSPNVLKSRKMTAELLLAEAYHNPEILRLAAELGVSEVRYQSEQIDDCVLCELCVRACKEIVGVEAISTIYRGFGKKVSPPFQIKSKVCIACGTCVLICPTNAIELNNIAGYERSGNGTDWEGHPSFEQFLSAGTGSIYRKKGNGSNA